MLDSRTFIPITRPSLDEREVEAARRAILSGWVTQGPEVAAFEREFSVVVEAPFACAVSSCTAALHLALLAVGIQPEDEIITVTHSFIATANAIRYCRARPVFVDIQPQTYNIDPAQIERAITKRTRAILCVHQMGMPADMEEIGRIASAHALIVVEDAACAIGSEILRGGRWEQIGKPHGHIACFSLHPRKVITTGEGGMITTANPDWDAQCRLLRQHGMSVPDTVRHNAREPIFESYEIVGYNYRMTDIQAAVGREQLHRLPDLIAVRRTLAKQYGELLADIPDVGVPFEPPWARGNWQSYCVRLPARCDQRQVMQRMLDLGVATRRGIMCAHREPAYPRAEWSCGGEPDAVEDSSGSCARLQESELAHNHSIALPLFPEMTEAEQKTVVAALRQAVGAAATSPVESARL